ncbi:hypothetical protein Lal_00023167 [Lupinus albus]|nr:hypothetical protein Lal_00023167 [Lupinus albus]
MSGKNNGNIIYIPQLSMSASQSPWSFTLIRRQFPIIVSYAMTMNKSQVFSHGQLYLAISRVQTKKGLKILISDKDGKSLKSINNVLLIYNVLNLISKKKVINYLCFY